MAKFEAAWKNLGKGRAVSEAPKYDFKKELEDSEAKRKELEIEIEQHKKHLQKMVSHYSHIVFIWVVFGLVKD